MSADAALSASLAGRTRLFARLLGIGFAAWQTGEALSALAAGGGLSGLGFMLSGVGTGLTIVAAIVLVGTVLHARRARAFDLFKDAAPQAAMGVAARLALIALGAAMAVAAAGIGLAGWPQAPVIDLVIAAPVLAFCLIFAARFKS